MWSLFSKMTKMATFQKMTTFKKMSKVANLNKNDHLKTWSLCKKCRDIHFSKNGQLEHL